MRVRFAPSPTGYLHVGGARTALFNWLLARRLGGTFILRIEDTDRERSRPEHVDAILKGLSWLGLDWDEGPYFQGEGADRHRADALALLEAGRAYRDFTPAEELAEARQAAIAEGSGSVARLPRHLAERLTYEEREERAAAGEPHAIRFLVPDGRSEWDDMVHGPTGFENAEIEDLVILRSDGSPTYNLAVVSDDADMAITHVIRGDDHVSNTPKQILLYEALGKTVPRFGHVPMILGPDGKRLSKRHGATAVEAYGAEGILPEAMVNFLALLGWSPGNDQELFSLEELIQAFSMERVLKKGAVFDTDKLHWLNGQYLARIPAEELIEPVRAAAMEGADPAALVELDQASALRMVEALKPRSRTLTEMAEQAIPFMERTPVYEETSIQKAWYREPAAVADRLQAVRDAIESTDWTEDALEGELRSLAERMEVGAGKIFQPLRLALTGRSATPGIFDVLLILGRERSMDRLDKAIPMVMEKARAVSDS